MWTQFFLVNAHFAVNLLMAMVMLSVAWLYFDAWSGHKTLREGLKVLGFGLLATSFLLHAVVIESNVLSGQIFGFARAGLLFDLVRIGGYLFLILGIVIDPLQPRPKHEGGGSDA